jgi:serine/threonine-protein kinase
MSPQQIAHYRITAKLGEGGMGEVYRATDTKLGREVAIKIIPEAFAQDAGRMARFTREAQVLASLNHPNIAAIYGVEERALVMELVEGETLAGPLPVETALDYARQIAAALEYAHEKGVVHRDLKPANVMVTPAGVVKVLDFGLAKAVEEERTGNPETSPTLTMRETQLGVILGTAAYMAPEQARGKTVDKRADIWAFGVVLWEMLTGKRLFEGETVSDTLAQVLTKEPDWERVPVRARRLLRACLQKDPKQRLQAIGDSKLLLEEAAEAQGLRHGGSSRWKWIASAFAFIALAVTVWALWPRPAELRPLQRLDVALTPELSSGFINHELALSPDGTRLVYSSEGRLFTRRLDQPKSTELATPDGARFPFFSPDGKWVAFFTRDYLMKIPAEGGPAIRLCEARTGRGGSWDEDDNIIAAFATNTAGLYRVPATGGTPVPVTTLNPGEVTQRWPQVLPGGKAVLFTANNNPGFFDQASVEVMTLGDRHRKTIQRQATFGRYLATSNRAGYLAYVNRGTLFAVPFDLDRLEMRGTPAPILEDVAYTPVEGFADFAFSQTGTLVYRSGTAGGLVTMQWLESGGRTSPLMAKPGAYDRLVLSPDGKRLALRIGADLWVYDSQRDANLRLTFDGFGNNPLWTPDGRYLLFQAPGGVFWTRSDGATKPQPLTHSKNTQNPWSFAPDGKRLAIMEVNPEGTDIVLVTVESDSAGLRAGKPEPYLHEPFAEMYPAFSPDGRWLAYSSNESGATQVYVRPFPGAPSEAGGRWQISNSNGRYPVWSRTAHELFFRTEDRRIMVASYAVQGDSFIPDKPRVWSEKRLANSGGREFDVAPDGRRIAALMPVETQEEQKPEEHLTFLLNFFDELKRRIPGGSK